MSGEGPWLDAQGEDGALLRVALAAFARLDPPGVMGLAVSGGSDSLAMLHLMARAAPQAGWRVAAVTVDHNLRPAAAEEAAFVSRTCAGIGVAHDTLLWQDHPATGNLMELASRARLALMADWARQRGIGHLALAHTADDEAEGVLMGLSRAAGLDGLAGMRRTWAQGGVTFHRPFLTIGRQALRDHLVRQDLRWCDDPTNDDPRYARVRARQALRVLRPLGITVGGLGETVRHLQDVLAVMRQVTGEALAQVGREEAGAVVLGRSGLAGLPPEVRRRLLVAAVQWLSGQPHRPRAAAVGRLALAVAQGRAATLAGCRARVGGGEVRLLREVRAVAGMVTATDAVWDGRWHLDGPHGPGLEVRALGAEGLRLCPDWRATGLPREVLAVTPAIWRGDDLVAAPVAGVARGWSASVRPTLAATIAAH